jgi:hypothetical protein
LIAIDQVAHERRSARGLLQYIDIALPCNVTRPAPSGEIGFDQANQCVIEVDRPIFVNIGVLTHRNAPLPAAPTRPGHGEFSPHLFVLAVQRVAASG